ncbi:serine acetyltransferase [Haematobacter missouriensis]|uniref:Serine acetyltransferase n=1 Tax=Haematobacter missouriensis TaxID=366616 RepID=A0ABX3ZTV0_9RHOB|nr:serine acetyltransferase [Haematobacter missouriensis]KFI26931.1 serine acetyltransferase [Haematobacter missouriensis]OWJ76215.1 serine acetyltransferase [Haematobacter missouriensis]
MARLGQLFFAEANRRIVRDIARMQSLQQRGHGRVALLFSRLIQRRYGVFTSPLARFGKGVHFPHPTGIVIGEGVVIGDKVTIYQNVTLGGARLGDWQKNNYPEIGSNTVIFAGAVIVGRVKIGAGCTIGANSVVLTDVPDGATAVGAPARILYPKNPDPLTASGSLMAAPAALSTGD